MSELPQQRTQNSDENPRPGIIRTMRIFFICPLPQWEGEPQQFLAARTKIFLLIEILKNQGFEVVLINSGRQMGEVAPMDITNIALPRGGEVSAVIGPSRERTSFGRLLTLFSHRRMLDLALERFGEPDIVWCYNAYAFEMLAVRYLTRRRSVIGVLEFEDHPLARMRGLQTKPVLDWLCWQWTVKRFDLCYAVNGLLSDLMNHRGVETDPLPGLSTDEDISWYRNNPPDFEGSSVVVVAYSGGLDRLKGADFLLELISISIDKDLPIEWHITGSGPFESQFKRLSELNPSRINYHGVVSVKQLRKIRTWAQVVLNPHKPNSGVFPFKVLDAVCTGRLVISSPLEHAFDNLGWLDEAVYQVELNSVQWTEAILNTELIYRSKSLEISNGLQEVEKMFSETGFGVKVQEKLRALMKLSDRGTAAREVL